MTKITGVIQGGGRSTRMGGEPKALLELGGKRIVERVGDALGAALADLLVVTNTPERYAFLGLPMVADRYPDGGSLGGIFMGLEAAGGDPAFIVPCDMPFLSPDFLRLLSERAGEAHDYHPHPTDYHETMYTIYPKASLEPMPTRL